jgi:predicted ester cyclase
VRSGTLNGYYEEVRQSVENTRRQPNLAKYAHGCWTGAVQDPVCGLPRTPLLGTWVNNALRVSGAKLLSMALFLERETSRGRPVVTAEQNKAVVSRYFQEFHDGREHAILEEIMTPDLLEGTRQVTEMLLTAFPDYRLTIEEQIAEGDKVATVWNGSGTHQGEWESPAGTIAPTGRQVMWTGTTTLRLSEGQISDVIASSWDHLGILQQLGAVEVTEPRTGA